MHSNYLIINNENNEHLIDNLKKLSMIYKEKKNEFLLRGDLKNLFLKSDYTLNRIIKETISLNTSLDNLVQKNVFLLSLDYDVEITRNYYYNMIFSEQTTRNDEVKDKEEDIGNILLQIITKEERNLNLFQCEKKNIEEENKSYNKEEIGNLEDFKIFSQGLNDDVLVQHKDLFSFDNRILNFEEFYLRSIPYLLKRGSFKRQIINVENCSNLKIDNCLRRYLIVNSKFMIK